MSLPVIVGHAGYHPYLEFTLRQARAHVPRDGLFLIGDGANDRFGFLQFVPGDRPDLRRAAARVAAVYQHRSTNTRAFELSAFQRWFRVQALMEAEGLRHALVLDSDVLLYAAPDALAEPWFGGVDMAVSTPQDATGWQWVSSGHSAYWTTERLGDCCAFIERMYAPGEWRDRAEAKWAHHVETGTSGGICDMTAFDLYRQTRPPETVGNTAAVVGGTTFDHNVNRSENRFPGEYRMRGGTKAVEWDGGRPAVVNERLGARVRFHTLHLQGQAKGACGRFYRGPRLRRARGAGAPPAAVLREPGGGGPHQVGAVARPVPALALAAQPAPGGPPDGVGQGREHAPERLAAGVVGLGPLARVDPVERRVGGVDGERGQRRPRRQPVLADVEQPVLHVVVRHRRVLPQRRPEQVDRPEPLVGEPPGPVPLPPLVDVVGAALVGDGRREQHGRRPRGERPDERPGGGLGQVLADLHRDRQVERLGEPVRQRQRAREVPGDEAVRRHQQLAAVDVVAVDADDRLDAGVEERAEPRPDAAPHVEHAPGRQRVHDEGGEGVGRPPGVLAVGVVERRVVGHRAGRGGSPKLAARYLGPMPDPAAAPPTVVTWLYAEAPGEESVYPQVIGHGAPSSTRFQAVYWRCVAVFFASLHRHQSGARAVLATNVEAAPTVDGHDLAALLARWGVETVRLPYTFQPPEGYWGAWRNQFYVFDVVRWLAGRLGDGDVGMVLDSDCVWARPPGRMAAMARRHGALTYDLGLPEGGDQNGLSLDAMAALYTDLDGHAPATPPPYVGGELVAATAETLRRIDGRADDLWAEMLRRHDAGLPKFNEEAQALSYLYHALGIPYGTANPYLRRIWTTLVKGDDARGPDLDLTVWHVPGEKRYGLRRLFNEAVDAGSPFWTLDGQDWRRHVARQVGLPRRSLGKLARDLPVALRDKLTR